jgi:hypothetical protein
MTARNGLSVRTIPVLAALGLAALALGACQRGDDGASHLIGRPAAPKKAVTAAEAQVDPALTEALRTMAAGVPLGTSTAPLDARFNLAAAPAPGDEFTIEVAVLPDAPAPVLRVEVTGGDGLTIVDPAAGVSFEKVQAGSVAHVHVRATSPAAGTRLVEVRATLELPDGPETRSFAFPVIVGAPPLPAAPAAAPVAKTAKG